MVDVARWYLDIDGVVSAMFPPAKADTYMSLQIPGNGDHWIQPKVIEFINSVADRGVEVVWLTSWEHDDATLHFAPSVGLTDFRHLPCTSKYGVEDFEWKRKALEADLGANPARSVVWTDDDLTADDVTALERVVSRSLAIAPNPNSGLTPLYFQRITDFLQFPLITQERVLIE